MTQVIQHPPDLLRKIPVNHNWTRLDRVSLKFGFPQLLKSTDYNLQKFEDYDGIEFYLSINDIME